MRPLLYKIHQKNMMKVVSSSFHVHGGLAMTTELAVTRLAPKSLSSFDYLTNPKSNELTLGSVPRRRCKTICGKLVLAALESYKTARTPTPREKEFLNRVKGETINLSVDEGYWWSGLLVDGFIELWAGDHILELNVFRI